MKVVIDPNVILDVLLKREPYYQASARVLEKVSAEGLEGYIPATCAADIYEKLSRELGDSGETYEVFRGVMQKLSTLTVSNDDVMHALDDGGDFESSLVAVCAESNRCSEIITRDPAAFSRSGIRIVRPEEM